jgi:hypothetical protein
MTPRQSILVVLLSVVSVPAAAREWTETTSDKRNPQTITIDTHQGEVKSLSWAPSAIDDSGCDSSATRGTVVERKFEDDGVSLKEIVIEYPNGARKAVSMPPEDYFDFSNATRSTAKRGIQVLTKVGRKVHLLVSVCGSGGFFSLKAIR